MSCAPSPRRSSLRLALLSGMTMFFVAAPYGAHAQAPETFWTGSISDDWFEAGNWSSGVPGIGIGAGINSSNPNPTRISGTTPASTGVLLFGIGGMNGDGILSIQGGGQLFSTTGQLGSSAGTEFATTGTVTVTGEGSAWTNSAQLTIGSSWRGDLTIADGGEVSNTFGVVGSQATGEGTVTVTGLGSVWRNTGSLSVGSNGTGRLTIANGGVVFNTSGSIASGTGGTGIGTVTVTGAGSTWNNSTTLIIGTSGQGGLTVTNGGTVTNTIGRIGHFTPPGGSGMAAFPGGTGTGSVTVSGPGSTWTNTSTLFVGSGGSGVLTIENGGRVNSFGANIGTYVGSADLGSSGTGAVTVRGAGSTWAASTGGGLVVVGQYGGTGTLLIEDGGTVTAGGPIFFIGGNTGSPGENPEIPDAEGHVTVSGVGSTLSAANLIMGFSGTGDLTVTEGGAVTVSGGTLGMSEGGSGTVTVTGADSTLDVTTNSLTVGGSGEGELTIADGGTVNVNSSISLASSGPGTGAVTVTGSGSSLAVGNALHIGVLGDGELVIKAGGSVTSGGATIGSGTGTATGTATVTGADSVWVVDGAFAVGLLGQGKLFIADGGTVESSSLVIGSQAGGPVSSSGSVSVDGAGSTLSTSGDLVIGFLGEGELLVTNGGTVTTEGDAYIGSVTSGIFVAESTDTATVRGEDSSWDIEGQLTVGSLGEGVLLIEDGGAVQSGSGFIGNSSSSSTGTVTVTGEGSTWTNEAGLTVGDGGSTGALTIFDGGTVVNTFGRVGVNGSGAVTVTGEGSAWINSDLLTIGAGVAGPTATVGHGELTISEDGRVTAEEGVLLASFENATGILNIGAAVGEDAIAPGSLESPVLNFGNGTAILNFNHTGTEYAFDADLVSSGTGTHAIDHHAGTTILAGDAADFTGTTTILGGTLVVNGALGGAVNFEEGGKLGGSGTVGTLTVTSGAVLSPGNSIGTLNVDGDITFAIGSIYEVEVDPEGATSDLIHATGQAILEGGTVAHIGLDGIYAPELTYTILIADDGIVGTFEDATSEYFFLSPVLGYEENEVTLTLSRNDLVFSDAGETANQIAAGEGLESLTLVSPGHALYEAFILLDEDTARFALDQLSGEIHASGRHVVDRSFAQFSRSLGTRGQGGATALGSVPSDGRGFWLLPVATRGSVNGDGNAATLDWGNAGLIVGYGGDLGAVNNRSFFGVSAGYIQGHGAVSGRASNVQVSGWHFGLFHGWTNGSLSIANNLAFAYNNVATERRIGFDGFAQTARAEYGSDVLGFSSEIAYGFDLGGFTVSPLLALNLRWSSVAGATESGAGAGNLQIEDQGYARSFETGLGLALERRFETGLGNATLTGRAVWERSFGSTAPSQTLSFSGSPEEFTVSGPDSGSDRLRLDLGVGFHVNETLHLNLGYEGLFSGEQQSHGVSVGLSFGF